MNLKKLISLLSIVLATAAFSVAQAQAQSFPNLPWDGYHNWYHVTHAGPNTGDPTGFVEKKHGGEKGYREIYINSVGEATNKMEKPFPYPTGTVVVKETYSNKAAWENKKKPVLTVMIKLPKGSSPTSNDWEFYMGGNGKKKGRGIDTKWGKFCTDCHIFAAGTDFLFINSDFLANENK